MPALRVCILLPGLGPSGGVRVALQHARCLAVNHDMDVTVGLTNGSPTQRGPAGVRVVPVPSIEEEQFDVALATWWQTVGPLVRLPARRRVYFLQNFEERLYRPGDPERLSAALTHDLPLSFITEARWIGEMLSTLRPETPCHHVPNGIDKVLFRVPAEPPPHAGPLRVLVEGSPRLWFKGVVEAVETVARMEEPHELTLVTPENPGDELPAPVDRRLGPLEYREMPKVFSSTDVVVKLSQVEGVFTPPLEAFHCGATAVVAPVSGYDEYVVHGKNALVTDWDDSAGTARRLDGLARDPELLHDLKMGALATARDWPSWAQASDKMADALREIAERPEPRSGSALLASDLESGVLEMRLARMRVDREAESRRATIEALEERENALSDRIADLEAEAGHRIQAQAGRLLRRFRTRSPSRRGC